CAASFPRRVRRPAEGGRADLDRGYPPAWLADHDAGGHRRCHAARQRDRHDAGRASAAWRVSAESIENAVDRMQAAMTPLSLDAANTMDADAFVTAFGDVAEHAPWVAEAAAERRPFRS